MADLIKTRVSRSTTVGNTVIGGVAAIQTTSHQTSFAQTIPASTTNAEVNVVVDKDTLKVFAMETNKDDVVVKTNDITTPGNTFTLKANKPLIWVTGDAIANPVTVDITKIYVTTPAGDGLDVTFRFGAAYDASPVI